MRDSSPGEQIQKQMAALRQELYADVDEIVENARVLADWRYYVRRYPWVCLGAAAAVGFLIVPRRLELITPDAATLVRLAKKNQLLVRPRPEPEPKGPGSTLFSLLSGLIMRNAVAYLGQRIGALWSGLSPATHRYEAFYPPHGSAADVPFRGRGV